MKRTIPSIADILITSGTSSSGNSAAPLSIGVLSDADELFWGDCPSVEIANDEIVTAERLVDICRSKLRGQALSGFRALWEYISPRFPLGRGIVPIADGVRAALQQALLMSVASAQNRACVELLTIEYGLSNLDLDHISCPLFLEISDYAATAERIDEMLILRPAGIGYRLTGGRVAEALGENAEYLQRFVRELGQRSDQLSKDTDYQPAIYLGLNGSLGQLAGDPVRYIGKILGNASGLQGAAGSRSLFLEDPFLIETEDSVIQSANMLRLKDFILDEFIHRKPSTHNRDEPAQLVANASDLSLDELAQYADTQAVNAMKFDLGVASEIDGLMTQLTRLFTSGIDTFILMDEQTTPRWIETAVSIAMAARATGLIVSYNQGSDNSYRMAIRNIRETEAFLNRRRRG